MNCEIRELMELDNEVFKQIDFIEQSCFGKDEAFPTDDLPGLVEGCQVVAAAFDGDKMIGYALARFSFGIGYLYSNAVLKEYRGHGIGTLLLNYRIEKLVAWGSKIIQAHTKIDNGESSKLLQKAGLESVQYLPDFYEDNVDAILWSKTL